MEAIIGGAAPGADPNLIKNSTTETFMADVIDASHDVAVIVDFWAEWCGPCKTLGPQLEKAVRDAKGAVRMVKIDVDNNKELAAQMRIQSIPTVYAFRDGRPVDAFQGAIPESQIKQFVAKLAATAGPGANPIAEAVALAKEALTEGDEARAADIFGQIAEHDPGNVDAMAGLAKIALNQKDLKQAADLLAKIPAEHANHADVVAARTGLELAKEGEKASGGIGELQARLEKDPKDHQARLDLASALFASGEREQAIDQMLDLVRRDREWNEQAGRKQLVKFFEAIGLADPITVQARKRLSSILFS
ncbi:MAG TPA: thioredoxin [Stellaceae bacterium]|jgi:putative thioredoxin|nr:thioredoxin [Stellaceae bacterium]